jgi:hypothetical protein
VSLPPGFQPRGSAPGGKQTEAELRRDVTTYLASRRITVIHGTGLQGIAMFASGQIAKVGSGKGMPDILAFVRQLNGRGLAIELKTAHRKEGKKGWLREQQQLYRIKQLRADNVIAFMAESLEEVKLHLDVYGIPGL